MIINCIIHPNFLLQKICAIQQRSELLHRGIHSHRVTGRQLKYYDLLPYFMSIYKVTKNVRDKAKGHKHTYIKQTNTKTNNQLTVGTIKIVRGTQIIMNVTRKFLNNTNIQTNKLNHVLKQLNVYYISWCCYKTATYSLQTDVALNISKSSSVNVIHTNRVVANTDFIQ